MQDNCVLISFAIPTYNGYSTLKSTLDSLVSQILELSISDKSKIEIVVADDKSTDSTINILELYNNHNFFHYTINENNLGMDLNFRNVAIRSKGEFIWFFGQDDILVNDGLKLVLDNLSNLKPNILSLNYSQIKENGDVIDDSCLRNIIKGSLKKNHIYKFKTSIEYFEKFYSAPTFLPATIMRREFWESFNHIPFVGTCYVQVACILTNITKGNIIVQTKNVIKGLVPDNKWQNDGNELFKIMLGSLRMQYLVVQINKNSLPQKKFNRNKLIFLLRLYFLLGESINKGYIKKEEDKIEILKIYSSKITKIYIKYLFSLNYKFFYILFNSISFKFLKPIRKFFINKK